MNRDAYSEQQAHASFQPRSSQRAVGLTQFGQPVHHSSSTSDLSSKCSNKVRSWFDKFPIVQTFMNGSGDAIAPGPILPALKGTIKPALSQADLANQPLVGVIDAGFGPDEHGSKMVAAIQKENPQAKIWQGGGVGSGSWSESLPEFVNVAKAKGQRAVVNLSFDLTEVHPDGSTSTRAQLTAEEQSALAYARDNGVLVVASSGNQGGAMSALGQASQPSDNLIVVGAANGSDRASYSSYGNGLDLVAEVDAAGTSLAAAKVTGTIANIWSANPELSGQQVNQVLTATATDLKAPGWDAETGAGLLNSTGAIDLAKNTTPEPTVFAGGQLIQQVPESLGGATWKSWDGTIASERSNWGIPKFIKKAAKNTSNWAKRNSQTIADVGHTALDVAGMVPVVGSAADAVNAGWYLAEGDHKNAALSVVGMIPGAGDAATATKLAMKGGKLLKNGEKAVRVGSKIDKAAVKGGRAVEVATLPANVQGTGAGVSEARRQFSQGNYLHGSVALTQAGLSAAGVHSGSRATHSGTDAISNRAAQPRRRERSRSSEPSDRPKNTHPTSVSTVKLATNAHPDRASQRDRASHQPKKPSISSDSNPQKPTSEISNRGSGTATSKKSTHSKVTHNGHDSKTGSKTSTGSSTPLEKTIATSDPKHANDESWLAGHPQHTIRPGDTLWEIAESNLGSGTRWRELRKPDGSSFTERDARRLQPGESVRLPDTQPRRTETPTQSPWSPPPRKTPDPTPYIHTTSDRKYELDPVILSRLDEIRHGESLSEFAERIKTRIYDKNGVELTNSKQAQMPENTGGSPRDELEASPRSTFGGTEPSQERPAGGGGSSSSSGWVPSDHPFQSGQPVRHERVLEGTEKSTGGRQIDITSILRNEERSVSSKETYLVYTLRDNDGVVRYVGEASGEGTPAEVMKGRIMKGHDAIRDHSDLVEARIEMVQSNKAANDAGEEVLYSFYQVPKPLNVGKKNPSKAGGANEKGSQLYNKDPILSSKPEKIQHPDHKRSQPGSPRPFKTLPGGKKTISEKIEAFMLDHFGFLPKGHRQ